MSISIHNIVTITEVFIFAHYALAIASITSSESGPHLLTALDPLGLAFGVQSQASDLTADQATFLSNGEAVSDSRFTSSDLPRKPTTTFFTATFMVRRKLDPHLMLLSNFDHECTRVSHLGSPLSRNFDHISCNCRPSTTIDRPLNNIGKPAITWRPHSVPEEIRGYWNH